MNRRWRTEEDVAVALIKELLETYVPTSRAFENLLRDVLRDLIQTVERKVNDAHLEKDIQSARESTEENMKLIGKIITGDIKIQEAQ